MKTQREREKEIRTSMRVVNEARIRHIEAASRGQCGDRLDHVADIAAHIMGDTDNIQIDRETERETER